MNQGSNSCKYCKKLFRDDENIYNKETHYNACKKRPLQFNTILNYYKKEEKTKCTLNKDNDSLNEMKYHVKVEKAEPIFVNDSLNEINYHVKVEKTEPIFAA